MKSCIDFELAVILISHGAQIDRLALAVADVLLGWIKWQDKSTPSTFPFPHLILRWSPTESSIVQLIINYLKDYFRQNSRPGLHIVVALFLAAALYYNYTFHFKQQVLDHYWGTWLEVPCYFLFFAIPYFGTLLLAVRGTEDEKCLRNKEFWLVSLAMVLALTINRSSLHMPGVIVGWFDLSQAEAYYWRRCLNNVMRILVLVGSTTIFRQIWHRELPDLYGLRFKNFHWKPYLILLGIMVPPVIWASFQPAFLKTYPLYRPGVLEIQNNWPAVFTYGFHEICYALRFIGVELFFRGFLVLGMVKYLGRSVLLPMVVLYAFWHFGKPFPEALGSVFGSYILGIIALRSRSINGGILIHMGIALLMNLVAFFQLQMK
ncbi:MAG: CPBP family intramembrane metalloprotease [bacterium]|nr:CPBP family intramembrane metalloprotease [bacterium]